jgi:hypothetical protein
VNVDNLTSLDLADLVRHHRANAAAMTVATHWEPFEIPFGEVALTTDGAIRAVIEKPVKRYRISSGTYVLSNEACSVIPPGRPMGAPALVERLRDLGGLVAPYEHDSHWIDVNDSDALDRAEKMALAHADSFDLWRGLPDAELSAVLPVSEQGAAWLTRRKTRSARYPGMFELVEHDVSPAEPIICFDDADPESRTRVRYHVYRAANGTLPNDGEWVARTDPALSPPARRALQALRVSEAADR